MARSDEQIKADDRVVSLLAAVTLGQVTRESSAVGAPYFLDGEPANRLHLRWLADDDLIDLPISGPPTVAPRGVRLLRELVAEYRAEAGPDGDDEPRR